MAGAAWQKNGGAWRPPTSMSGNPMPQKIRRMLSLMASLQKTMPNSNPHGHPCEPSLHALAGANGPRLPGVVVAERLA
eukprot:2164476-Lingulodinium_polyedra.AAC.1